MRKNINILMSVFFVGVACFIGQTDRLNGVFTLLLWGGWQLSLIREEMEKRTASTTYKIKVLPEKKTD